MGGKGDRPTVENRWWVDQGKDAKGDPIPRPPATFGHRFFRTGDGFDQDRARVRLTDLNLKWFDEASPAIGEWAMLHAVPRERFSPAKVERVKTALRLPAGCRGILIDSGHSLRAIISGEPLGERLVELRLGGDCSFDAWVSGEWVREAFFRGFDDTLRRAPRLIREYLTTDRGAQFL